MKELMSITGIDGQMIKSLRRRNAFGLAWGRSEVYESLNYLPLDAVGMLLVMELGKAYNSKGEKGYSEVAAMIRVHADAWARVVAEAERDFKTRPGFNVRFCIVDFVRDSDGKRAHLVGGSRDTDDEAIARAIAQSSQAKGYIPARITCANVSRLLLDIRTRAYANGIDLTAPYSFMPDPASDVFKKL